MEREHEAVRAWTTFEASSGNNPPAEAVYYPERV
jgi:hypothetical protein